MAAYYKKQRAAEQSLKCIQVIEQKTQEQTLQLYQDDEEAGSYCVHVGSRPTAEQH